MASRSLDDLTHLAHESTLMLLDDAERNNLELLIYCTYRGPREQARLYRNGRTIGQIKAKAEQIDRDYNRPDLAQLLIDVGPQYGTRKVTWAGPGESNHQYGFAIDAVPMRNGKPVWGKRDGEDLALWKLYGRLAVRAGFDWAGDWKRHREFPHAQILVKSWRDLIRTHQFDLN